MGRDPELVISNHRACQDSISLVANWTNANEASKTSFRLRREWKPRRESEREGERKGERDNEEAAVCV